MRLHPKPPRMRSTIATDSPPIDTERPKARKLEPNIGDEPTEIVRSPQFGVKRPGKAILATRGPSRGLLWRFWPACPARCVKHRQGTPRKSEGGGSVMSGKSVWLGSTHPKPSRTEFRSLLAPIWQESRESVKIVLKPSPGALRNRGRTRLWWACKRQAAPGAAGTHPRATGPELENIGVRHGV